MSTDEFENVDMWYASDNTEMLRETFTHMKLKSMITDKAWNNYIKPFGGLKDGRECFVK